MLTTYRKRDIGRSEDNPKANQYHVPVFEASIFHLIQTAGHVRMAIVTENVVHAVTVASIPLCDGLVPTRHRRAGPQLLVSQRILEGHLVFAYGVRACKIENNALGIADAHMSDERQNPGDERQWSPDDGERVAMPLLVNGGRACAVQTDDVYMNRWCIAVQTKKCVRGGEPNRPDTVLPPSCTHPQTNTRRIKQRVLPISHCLISDSVGSLLSVQTEKHMLGRAYGGYLYLLPNCHPTTTELNWGKEKLEETQKKKNELRVVSFELTVKG